MSNARISHASTDFFIAAALLALFGAASLHNAGAHGALQLGLAVLMGGAGAFLRSGTDEARLVGLGAAGLTVAIGAYSLVVQNNYFVGTIVAVFAIFRLWGAGTSVAPQVPAAPPATSPAAPLAPFDAPDLYGGSALPPRATASPVRAPFYPTTAPVPFFPTPESKPEGPA